MNSYTLFLNDGHQGEKAIWSPWTGIVDWAVVCQHFAEDFKKMGGDIFFNFEVAGFAENVESKGKSELTPLCLYSKNRVSSSNFKHLYPNKFIIML